MNNSQAPGGHDPSQHPPRGIDRFFSWVRGLGIVRGNDRWFAGVAGGIAAKAGIDPLIVRGIFVVLALLGGPGLLLYVLGWLLLPDFTGKIHIEELFRGRASAGVIVAAVFLGLFVIIPLTFGLLPGLFNGGFLIAPWAGSLPGWVDTTFSVIWYALVLPALVVGGIIWFSTRKRGGREDRANQQPHTQPAPPTQPAEPQQAAAFTASHHAYSAQQPGASADDPGATYSTPGQTQYEQQNWSNQVGDWSRNVREEAKQWSDLGQEYHRAHRVGAAHLLLTLALTLLAAGAAAAWTTSLALSDERVYTAALLAAVVVLACSVIVAGVRGRQTGWIGFLTFVGVVALVFAPFTGVLPKNTELMPFGANQIRVYDNATDSSSVKIAGTTTLDLSGLTPTATPRTIEVWLFAGTATVDLPKNYPVEVHTTLVAGGVHESQTDRDFSQSGPFITHNVQRLPGVAADREPVVVNVRVMFGNVRINGPEQHSNLELEGTR